MWKILLLFLIAAAVGYDFPTPGYLVQIQESKLKLISKNEGSEKNLIQAEIVVSGFDLNQNPEDCESGQNTSCLFWRNEKNEIFTLKMEIDDECTTFNEQGPANSTAAFFFRYGEAQWYGGAERYLQEWPIQKAKIENDEPYIVSQNNNQAVLEPYWLSSEGAVIYVKSKSQLFFNSNQKNGTLGLIVADRAPYKIQNSTQLQFDLCSFANPTVAHREVIKRYFQIPKAHPGKRMMTYPTYSTWAKYYSDINQEKVTEFTNKVLENNYLMGQIEIDDKWETCYGSLIVDTNRFSNIKQLTDYIHSKGGRATAWVYPFINEDCDAYEPALKEGRLVLDENGSARMQWWNGVGGAVDVTNKTTKDWWVSRLRSVLESSGLDGFKFDAGESSFLPQLPQITADAQSYPDSYVRNYVEAAAEFGSDLEVRVGRNTQDVPVFVRMLDKDSRWGLDNGLKTVITTALQMSMTGYPFILPDMIGGNGYGGKPSKELFIRWAQANALLPAMQFSILPWDFDQETVDLARNALDLHISYTDTFLSISNQTLTDAVWWIAPQDPEALPISDQYLLGEKTLVAPVVTEGAVERDVYLPSGTWLDARNETYEGPKWLRNYAAPLSFLPVFTKIK